MNNNYDYPLGADNPFAPWNDTTEPEMVTVEIDVLIQRKEPLLMEKNSLYKEKEAFALQIAQSEVPEGYEVLNVGLTYKDD